MNKKITGTAGSVGINPVGPFGPFGPVGTTPNIVTYDATPFRLDIKGNTRIAGDLIINTDNGEEINVSEFITAISNRLCMIQPNFEAHKQYPALKDAYDQYKMLERLLDVNNKTD